MSEDCAGRHACEPPHYPQELGHRWTCPDCGRKYQTYDVHASNLDERFKRHVPAGTIGWTTRDA